MTVVLADFSQGAAKAYLKAAIDGFHRDPPDTSYQRGYLDALIESYRVLHGTDDGVVVSAQQIPRRAAITEVIRSGEWGETDPGFTTTA